MKLKDIEGKYGVGKLDNEVDEDQEWIDHCFITVNGTEEQIEAYISFYVGI